MSLPVRTYAELLDRIEALAGKDSFTANEQTRILSLVNSRLYSAYRSCDYWPRYITVGEARPTTDNVVPYTQDTQVLVSGAGFTVVDGTYTYDGELNGKPSYISDGGNNAIQWDSGQWIISTDNNEFISVYAYTSTDDVAYPWLATFVNETTNPVPSVTEVSFSDIDTFLRLYTGPVYGSNESGCELDFYVGNDGAHPTNTQAEWDQLYVTYKRVWDGPYLANSTQIPQEFFDYAAMAVLADWLRSNGNFEEGRAAEAEANSILDFEKLTKQVLYNARIYAPAFNTYISHQNRNF